MLREGVGGEGLSEDIFEVGDAWGLVAGGAFDGDHIELPVVVEFMFLEVMFGRGQHVRLLAWGDRIFRVAECVRGARLDFDKHDLTFALTD